MKRLAYYAVRDMPSAGVQLNDVITLREDGIWVLRMAFGYVVTSMTGRELGGFLSHSLSPCGMIRMPCV